MLEDACQNSPALAPYFKPGLGALKNSDRGCIKVPDTRLLSGSVALDQAAAGAYPLSNRWDYAIEYGGHAFFIEIHPASTSEIDCMIKKVKCLKEWSENHCPQLMSLPSKCPGGHIFYWVSSGGTDLRVTPGSKQAKKLALHSIKNVGKIWDYARLFK